MEGPNYFRAAYEYFARLEKNSKDKNSEVMQLVFKHGVMAPKFVLPEGGKILDNDLKCLPEKIRLPYPVTVIEYYHKENYLQEMAAAAAEHHVSDPILKMMTAGHCYRDKIVVIATQWEDGPIGISVINHVPDQNSWIATPFTCDMPSDKGSLIEALKTGKLPMNATQHIALSQAWFEKLASASMKGPITAIMELVEALSFSNITEVEIPAKKMTFTEQRKKALPYDSYRMLVVNKTEAVVSAARSETGVCGERRLAREHTRRGHDRTYKASGKKIWINPMVINAGIGSKIVKDYQLK